MNTRRFSKGFTLIETLLAITLFAVVMAASYRVFAMGIQIWQRTQGSYTAERKAVLALEKMIQKVRAVTRIEKIDKFSGKDSLYEGDQDGFTLPATVENSNAVYKPILQFGRIGFYWDRNRDQLCETQESATDLYLRRKPPCRVLAEYVKKVDFRYWLYRSLGESYSWYDDWDSSDGLPQAIQVTLEIEIPVDKTAGSLERRYQRMIWVPVGGKT